LRYPNGQIERVIVGGADAGGGGDRSGTGLCGGHGWGWTGPGADDDDVAQLDGQQFQGPVMISLDPGKPTVGQIEEKVNTTPGVLGLT